MFRNKAQKSVTPIRCNWNQLVSELYLWHQFGLDLNSVQNAAESKEMNLV